MRRQKKALLSKGFYAIGVVIVVPCSLSETLLWNRNPEPDIAGYKVFYGQVNTSPAMINVGNVLSHRFTNLVAGRTYFFYVTAYNTAALESNPSQTLNYIVPAQNMPPTISSIPNQTIFEDAPTAMVGFTVNDPDTALSSLVLSALSSNTNLIANASFAFGGSGANRTLSYSPRADQSGSAVITVKVSDAQNSASTSFNVTVAAVNDVPTISNVADQSIPMNGSSGPLAVSISDKETAAGSLALTAQSSNTALVPQSGLVPGGSGGSRTITVTPVSNQAGQATITLTVSDGASTASDTFVVTVSETALNYLLVENFEAPGYETPGWFEVNNPIEATRAKLESRHALRTERGSQAYRVLNGATNLNLYFMVSWREIGPTHTLLDLGDSAGQPAGFVWLSGGQIRLTHGGVTTGAPFSYMTRSVYHVWLEWTKGGGANGSMRLYVDQSATKPAAPIAALNTGNGQAVEHIYFGGAGPDSPVVLFDKVRLADRAIGSDPGL